MMLQYVDKIRANISIQASKKTSNLLDGLYRSVFKGRSLDFDDLRDYVYGDDSKDIDWKSSIRHGQLLVRRYVAFKRHNIVFIIDSGSKMTGLNRNNEKKSETAIYTFGSLAYLVNKNEDEISCVYNKDDKIFMSPFKSGLSNIEMHLNNIENNIDKDTKYTINDLLEYSLHNSKRKMIMVVISDIAGLRELDEKIVRRIVLAHDLMFININDASMFGENIYDIESSKDLPKFITNNKKIQEVEEKERTKIIEEKTTLLKKYRVTVGEISSKSEIVNKLIDLLERHNNAIRR